LKKLGQVRPAEIDGEKQTSLNPQDLLIFTSCSERGHLRGIDWDVDDDDDGAKKNSPLGNSSNKAILVART
jgi:hypothetical protein